MDTRIGIQYQHILEHFPKAEKIGNNISHLKIELNGGIILKIDYSKYPKRPKVILINQQTGKIHKKLNNEIESLRTWKKTKSKSILDVLNEIVRILGDLQSNLVRIKRDLLEGFFTLSREHHPKEFLGVLKMEQNIFTEFILPPGAATSRTSGVFFPNRLPLNRYYQGTIHSHPSGNPHPSLQDLNSIFKSKNYNFIVGFPYTFNNIKCFDKDGTEIKFKVID
ncbi:MAG: hypothetical protein P8Y70_13610 [Candidatus Lokiarchaeota archaeon]